VGRGFDVGWTCYKFLRYFFIIFFILFFVCVYVFSFPPSLKSESVWTDSLPLLPLEFMRTIRWLVKD